MIVSRISGVAAGIRGDLAVFAEGGEFVSDVVIYRCVYSQNKNENYVTRDPTEREPVPEWPHGKVAVCSL